jgi:hypothetical protein
MFVGAQLAHFGERARERSKRARAALGFGTLPGIDVMAADDHLDLRQFAFDRAGDALDQRDAGGRRRIGGALDRGAPAQHLPFVDRGARDLVVGIDRDRLGANRYVGGSFGPLAFLDSGIPLRLGFPFEGVERFGFCGFFDDALRCFFCRRFLHGLFHR